MGYTVPDLLHITFVIKGGLNMCSMSIPNWDNARRSVDVVELMLWGNDATESSLDQN